jgi:hypothetical protein
MPALLQLAATLLVTSLPPRALKPVHPNATGCNIQTQRKISLPHLNSPSPNRVFPNKPNQPHSPPKNRDFQPATCNQTHQSHPSNYCPCDQMQLNATPTPNAFFRYPILTPISGVPPIHGNPLEGSNAQA